MSTIFRQIWISGVLKITLPKKEEVKFEKKIEIA